MRGRSRCGQRNVLSRSECSRCVCGHSQSKHKRRYDHIPGNDVYNTGEGSKPLRIDTRAGSCSKWGQCGCRAYSPVFRMTANLLADDDDVRPF